MDKYEKREAALKRLAETGHGKELLERGARRLLKSLESDLPRELIAAQVLFLLRVTEQWVGPEALWRMWAEERKETILRKAGLCPYDGAQLNVGKCPECEKDFGDMELEVELEDTRNKNPSSII